jgi:hypothetical protein
MTSPTDAQVQEALKLQRDSTDIFLGQVCDMSPEEFVAEYFARRTGRGVCLFSGCVGALAAEVDVSSPGALATLKELEALYWSLFKGHDSSISPVYRDYAKRLFPYLRPATEMSIADQVREFNKHIYTSQANTDTLFSIGCLLRQYAIDCMCEIAYSGDYAASLDAVATFTNSMDDTVPQLAMRRNVLSQLGALVAKSSNKVAKAFFDAMLHHQAFSVYNGLDKATNTRRAFPQSPFFFVPRM